VLLLLYLCVASTDGFCGGAKATMGGGNTEHVVVMRNDANERKRSETILTDHRWWW